MTGLLEITGDDIALLNDTDLRSLIGLLCEADFRYAGLPTKGIFWGGHQDASDGGLDVIVRSDFPPPQNSFVPRKITGFQIKKPDMPRSKILKEMRPGGELREEIKALIRECGAYMIVSSEATADPALKNRINAMKEAVANEPNYQQLQLDFLDRGSVATWLRSHPSLILWVRDKIGRPLKGWRPYENWANAPAGVQEQYLIDDKVNLYGGTSSGEGNSVINGLQQLRLRLSNGGASVRLIGLSGVGKTRLVQALFDDRVGEHALDPTLAYYTDISNSPIPDPPSFANQLILADTKAVLIVDNCSLELHRLLTKACANSRVSLLTVEYDIRDDLPEETDVFRLEPASDELIRKLLEKRYANISLPDIRTIAEFAGGNARVAIALANTLEKDESLSTLRDEELFERLFRQRHDPNEDLLISAEVCSLVYSFDGVDTTSKASELVFLGDLVNKPALELYRGIQELKNRGLVQSRGVWRAILPPAIANRLAKRSLNSIPKNVLVNAFLSHGSERLIKSFTRRLGYLHDCTPAVEIASDWLKPDGWIGETNCNFNPFGLTIFMNIAPIVPEASLAMLERAASEENERVFTPEADIHRHEFIRLLQHLTYEPALFQRSVRLLCRCALLEKPDINDGGSARATLKTLFHIFLSGTHASPQVRASITDELVNSKIQDEAELGIVFLEAALQTDHFFTTHTSNFGARPRDFGYRPKSSQEVSDWYELFVGICTRVAISDKSVALKAKRALANNLPGLWTTGADISEDFLEMLEDAVTRIHERQAWNEGWLSVRGILRYHGKSMPQEALSRLKHLEELLKPADLLEQARTYALIGRWSNFDVEDDFEENEDILSHMEKVQEVTRRIGAEVVQDVEVFNTLLPELVTNYSERLGIFGAGLADGCEDPQKVWQMLYFQLEKAPPERRQIDVLLGFLSACADHDPDFFNATLDNLIEDEMLGQWFPVFQTTSAIDKRGIERLHSSLDTGKAQINSFRRLAWGRRHESIDDDNLAALIQKILTKEGGLAVAIDILSMRFHRSKDEPVDYSRSLVAVTREVISKYPYDEKQDRNNRPDHKLAQLTTVCLRETDGAELTKKICLMLADGFQQHRIYTFDYPYLLRCLAQIQPYIFLDVFIRSDEIRFYGNRFDDLEQEDNPVNQIPEDVLIQWCEQDPETRYRQVVVSMQTYSKPKEPDELQWKPVIFSFLEKSPNVQAILSNLGSTIQPTGWSSYADTLEKRLPLFTALFEHKNPIVRDWAKTQHLQLQRAVEKRRENELKENQARFQRFE